MVCCGKWRHKLRILMLRCTRLHVTMHYEKKNSFARLKGYCTSYPKKLQNRHILCSIWKLSTSFWKKIIYASYSKLSKELKNSIKIKVGQAIFELLIQKQHIYNLKTACPIKISMPFLSSLNNFFIRFIICFSRSCWLFWDRGQNMLICGIRCSTPLRVRKMGCA